MANEQFVSRYRKYGEEQPYWKAGIFKIRLPFVHYKWSVPEMVQAVFMCATCLGAIPVPVSYTHLTLPTIYSV